MSDKAKTFLYVCTSILITALVLAVPIGIWLGGNQFGAMIFGCVLLASSVFMLTFGVLTELID